MINKKLGQINIEISFMHAQSPVYYINITIHPTYYKKGPVSK